MATIAIDVMGGDYGPAVTLPAASAVLERHADLELLLVGPEAHTRPAINEWPAELCQRVDVIEAPGQVTDTDRPEVVLRGKRDSSLFRSIELLSNGRADACVSAGNTGALLLASRHLLEALPGVRKPAMIASLPVSSARTSRCHLLDVGANLECDAEQLLQFAVMGSVLASVAGGRQQPRVGLLNIGVEEHKGALAVREAAELLKSSPYLDYAGFVEAHGLFRGEIDVLVCDGITGNITIKTSAGVIDAMEQTIAMVSRQNRLAGWLARPMFTRVRRRLDPSRYNGASLLGLHGSVIKSHGNADRRGFETALEQALEQVRGDLPGRIAQGIGSVLGTL